MKILIATTNPGKFEEFKSEFADLDFDFVSLKDVKLDKEDLQEPYEELWQNALHKAKYFAQKSGLITIAEDSGFFVDFLNGEPGIKSRRYGKTAEERIKKIINNLSGVPTKKRGAYFKAETCIYNPKDNSFSVFTGQVNGLVAEKIKTKARAGMDYDACFYYPPYKKTFAELSKEEKSLVSHRGKVINQLKRFLTKQFAFKQYLAVGALIVKDRKVYLAKRRDLRPEFNNKWEFPGGSIENSESVKGALLREVKEETGYDIEPLEQLPYIINKTEKKYGYQVFLLLYVAKIIGGKFKTSDNEVAGYGWFTLKEAQKLDFLPANKMIMKANRKILEKYID